MKIDQKITIEEYYITFAYSERYIIRYVTHNGYTTLKPVAGQMTDLSLHVENHPTIFTRYNKPHQYKPIKFNRKRKLAEWAEKMLKDGSCSMCDTPNNTLNKTKE